MENKEVFLTKNKIADKFYELERHNPNLWDTMVEIYEDYAHRLQNGSLRKVITGFIEDIGSPAAMHSMRYRIKTPESLIVKIIHKKYSDFTDMDYSSINKDTYGKVIMDLLGARILIRHRYLWEDIHDLIWNRYYKGTEKYVKNRIIDYIGDDKTPFLAERPKVFYRYEENTKQYELKGRDTFDFEKNNPGYSSNHYIVNYYGTYIELQVRTLFDEAWSENDHDFVYKLYAGNKKLVLNRTSKLLSKVAEIADELSMFMHDYYDESIFSVPGDKQEGKKTITERVDRSSIYTQDVPKYDSLHSRSETSKSIGDINDLY
ncbi:MAG: pyrophosphokinae [Herbinix sp.]|jgi:ppGpp synthetase/RelA/SpoT-type nucleotidyltranferase|nr:pyrophosphokinae [Herbinix sp.]